MIRSNTAHLVAENFDARLAGIVIWLDCPLFEEKKQGPSNQCKSTTLIICVFNKSRASLLGNRRSAAGSCDTAAKGWYVWHIYINIYISKYPNIQVSHMVPYVPIWAIWSHIGSISGPAWADRSTTDNFASYCKTGTTSHVRRGFSFSKRHQIYEC